jgi:hypothetical protein
MTWARVVEDEIVQIFEEDPSQYFHPDTLHEWVDIPNEGVHVGWKLKNGQWISGTQWYEEFLVENPMPPEGPPSVNIGLDHKETRTHDQLVFTFVGHGNITSHEWTIDGKKYEEEKVSLEIEKGQQAKTISVSIKVTGPGGSTTKTREGDEEVVITPVFTPLFQSRS